ncbi:DUF87 domain-containing protein [candidate division WOR-3 bacterium]|nr:DUF87 domain-containing protein [candidate division WOR-3 bacterium]
MQDFEKLGFFYIGKKYDFQNKKLTNDYFLYDSRDLLTHAVCLGMTGSGKTGLCVTLLEEAVIDGIPSLIIDPKGDIANILLTFPELKTEDFLPWINLDDARKENMTEHQFAEKQANIWKNGIMEWGQSLDRINLLKQSSDFRIYTPGSNAGLPVSFLRSLKAPNMRIASDREYLNEKVNSTVTSLLKLVGVQGDPLNSREHILLVNIFEHFWSDKKDLNLELLIQSIQKPPMNKVGIMDLETFFPAKDRFDLSVKFNNIIASPSFNSWTAGAPLDIDGFLRDKNGKPRVSIFSISHLNDSERMFFVSLFLTNLLEWTRSQEGTSSLRAIFYMDEIFGYFPPGAMPPSKPPLLSLLKQARAFGLGVVLASQNPVDLDYKGLSNIGTWFIGRLQTARDKEKLIDGLKSLSMSMSEREISDIISSIGKRIFLVKNIHGDKIEILMTRWALSYLRGPMTKEMIKKLTPEDREGEKDVFPDPDPEISDQSSAFSSRITVPQDINEYFIPCDLNQQRGIVYKPYIMTSARIFYKIGKDVHEKKCSLFSPFSKLLGRPDLDNTKHLDFQIQNLTDKPCREDASFIEIPEEALNAKYFDKASKIIKDWIYRNVSEEVLKYPFLKEVSKPGEGEKEFRTRISQQMREKRDEEVDELRTKYAAKFDKLEEKEARAFNSLEKKKDEAADQKSQSAISFGSTIIGALIGGRRLSVSNLGRAATSVRSISRVNKKNKEEQRARQNYEKIAEEKKDLKEALEKEVSSLQEKFDVSKIEFEKEKIFPKKGDIFVDLSCLVWRPFAAN